MNRQGTSMKSIEWRPAPGYEGIYEVSNHGQVRRIPGHYCKTPGGRILKPWLTEGYPTVAVYDQQRKRRHVKVHRLVALAFHGDPEPGQEVRHLDGDRTNPYVENLKWGTRSENAQDTLRHGRHYNHLRDRTHCANGHEFTEENTLQAKDGRKCRRCRRDRVRAWRARKAKAQA